MDDCLAAPGSLCDHPKRWVLLKVVVGGLLSLVPLLYSTSAYVDYAYTERGACSLLLKFLKMTATGSPRHLFPQQRNPGSMLLSPDPVLSEQRSKRARMLQKHMRPACETPAELRADLRAPVLSCRLRSFLQRTPQGLCTPWVGERAVLVQGRQP